MQEKNAPETTQTDSTDVQAESIVTVDSIRKEFGDLVAVDDVSFEVESGEFLSIIGPSGSGKTTVLRMIAGFIEPTAGEIYIGGNRETDTSPQFRDTNMIFQDLALFPHLSVAENISYGLTEAGLSASERDDKVTEMLSLMDLEGYGDRNIDELSGGEQQRVALARGIVMEPSVLLLDEPLGALDEKLKEQMKVELKQLQDRTGITFIYVTHDQELALGMSDRIAIIQGGELQQIGTPQETYQQPANPFVADFMGAQNIYETRVIEQNGTYATVSIGDEQLHGMVLGEVADGDQVRYIVRPEYISLSRTDGRISGRVVDLVYKGGLTDVIVDADIGTDTIRIQAEVHQEDAEGIEQNDEISLDWDDDRTLIVGEGT